MRLFKSVRTYQQRLSLLIVILAFGVVGTMLLVSSHAATPAVPVDAESGSVSVAASIVSDSTAASGQGVKFGVSSGGGSGGIPAAGSYVRPGTVGYLGATSALTVYQRGGNTPSGCSWQTYGLRCDTDNLTFDHAWFKGTLYWNGTGTLTVTNSIWEGGDSNGQDWGDIQVHNASATKIIVKDSTLAWSATLPYDADGGDVAAIWSVSDAPMDIERDDISGFPQGVDPPGNSIIDSNYFHDNRDINGNHRDGIFSQGGNNILIQRNYLDGPNGANVTAAIFFQADAPMTGIKVYANYLAAGPYYNLHNEQAVGLDVQNNTFGTNLPALNDETGTIGTWLNNRYLDGSLVAQP